MGKLEEVKYFISDIHIGSNYKTNWYQKDIHENYLKVAIDHMIDDNMATEIVILGDLIDLWAYPIDKPLPTVDDIINANPEILGASGRLARFAATANKQVTYVNGNHDMLVGEAEINRLIPKVNYIANGLYKYTRDSHHGDTILGMHGHTSSIYNSKTLKAENSVYQGLPLGYLVTRLVATHDDRKEGIARGRDHDGHNFLPSVIAEATIQLLLKLLAEWAERKAVGSLDIGLLTVAILCQYAGVGLGETLTLPDGNKISVGDACGCYHTLAQDWVNEYGMDLTTQALTNTDQNCELDWITRVPAAQRFWNTDQQIAALGEKNLVIMGHTHKIEECTKARPATAPRYWNAGFNCPKAADLERHFGDVLPTFLRVEVRENELGVSGWAVVHDEKHDTYTPKHLKHPGK